MNIKDLGIYFHPSGGMLRESYGAPNARSWRAFLFYLATGSDAWRFKWRYYCREWAERAAAKVATDRENSKRGKGK